MGQMEAMAWGALFIIGQLGREPGIRSLRSRLAELKTQKPTSLIGYEGPPCSPTVPTQSSHSHNFLGNPKKVSKQLKTSKI